MAIVVDITCNQHDMTYEDFKDLTRRMTSDIKNGLNITW